MNDFDALLYRRTPLTHVHQTARSRRVCPDSTLAAVLVRASCMIPPHVTIPAIVGGRTSLNLFAALVGPSGTGKGGSDSAARDAILFVGDKVPNPLLELPPGSGEGIARTFQHSDENTTHTALFSAPEVDTLGALMGRQGSTLEGELRKVFAGEALGFANAQKHTRTQVDRLSYRAGLIVGVQPRRASVLLNGADGGTPQRFIWASVLDRDMPETPPPCPEPLKINVPTFACNAGAFHDLDVHEDAHREIDAHQLAMHRGDENVDPLGGHALLTRLKVAAALMLLDERTHVTQYDWRLAAQVMLRSDATRAAVQRELSAKARRDNRVRAWAADERDEFSSDRKLVRCKEGILRWIGKLADGEQLASNELRSKLKVDVRDYMGAALAELIDQGVIKEVPLTRGKAYRKVQGVPRIHPVSPADTPGVPVVQGVPEEANICRRCGSPIGSTGKCVPCIVRRVSA